MSATSIPMDVSARHATGPLAAADSAVKRLRECSLLLRQRVKQEAQDSEPRCPTSRWLIENHSYLQFQIRKAIRALPASYVRSLPKVGEGITAEFRIYRLAASFVAENDEAINSRSITEFAATLKEVSPLMMGELWAFESMLKLALLERLCEGLGSEQIVSRSITSLRALEHVNWCEFVESVSIVESSLKRDPAGIYARMDFATRDRYRHQVEALARRARFSEKEIADRAIACADAAIQADDARHVGYHLIGPGAARFKRLVEYRPPFAERFHDLVERWPSLFYALAVCFLTTLIVLAFQWIAGPASWWLLILLLVPASQAAVETVNSVISRVVPPRSLPSMDFSAGIPHDCQTLVVVPTLLLSPQNVASLIEDLEIRYLANRDENLYFGLLTDFPDADQSHKASDTVLLRCIEGIQRLNVQYGSGESGPFYLFHRPRRWNPYESKWMGYERKRGKLNDLNQFLLGRGNPFELVISAAAPIGEIRYVITLDTDTQLPRDAAAKMIAAAAHPLNRPRLNPSTGMVQEGFAVICPRVSVSMESAGRSRLAQIFGGLTGFDPYATAVSDVYQDLHGRASFIGKGIYDVQAFDAAVGTRFPENAILSHDLIEGEHARTGLLTNVELVENYPTTYEGFAKRKHRWVRGDWQLLPWLLPWCPGSGDRLARNRLSCLSRWKVFDNLRRSLWEVCILLLLMAGLRTAESPLRWTLAILAMSLLGSYADLLLNLVRVPEPPKWPAFVSHLAEQCVASHRVALLNLALVPHQACMMADAIVRTLFRRFITHRNLLEWEPMAQTELTREAGINLVQRYLYLASLLAFLAIVGRVATGPAAVALCFLWIAAPLVVRWLDQPPPAQAAISESDRAFLRSTALKTWRFFADHSGPGNHWLAPDNIQEDPQLVADRTSPTNIGLLLNAHLAAFDFGYVTRDELTTSLQKVMDAVNAMPRYRGHFFNWYDTRTLRVEAPRIVSTVDSGNLAASLCALRQGCLAMLHQPVLSQAVLEGLRDHALRLRDEVPYLSRSGSLMRLFSSLLRQLESQPTDLLFWESVLTDARDTILRIRESLSRVDAEPLSNGESGRSQGLRYWESLLLERVEAVLCDLYRVAPWLDPTLEPELRLNTRDVSLAPLVADFCRVPETAELPIVYERICTRLMERLHSAKPLYPDLRKALEDLLNQLPDAHCRARESVQALEKIASRASRLLNAMDFRFLFDRDRKLLHVGFDVDTGRLEESCYDLLASEARTAVFLAIAKGDIPREAWFRLGRKLTAYRGRRTLVSWNGTVFEYLMPLLHVRTWANTLLDRAMVGAVAVHQTYAAERGIPWGISESAHAARDSRMQYQYRAFGVPHLSANTRSPENVVAPYASLLALMIAPRAATANLRSLAALGCLGSHGFYDSIQFSSPGVREGELVRCYMAHHQAMSLLAIDNVLFGNRMQERFHREPLVQAAEFLLQERMPAIVDIINDDDCVAA